MSVVVEDKTVQEVISTIQNISETSGDAPLAKIEFKNECDLIESLKFFLLAAIENQKCPWINFTNFELWKLDTKLYAEFSTFVEMKLKEVKRPFDLQVIFWNTFVTSAKSDLLNLSDLDKKKYCDRLIHTNTDRFLFDSCPLPFAISIEDYKSFFEKMAEKSSKLQLQNDWAKNCLLLPNEKHKRGELEIWYSWLLFNLFLDHIKKYSALGQMSVYVPNITFDRNFEEFLSSSG